MPKIITMTREDGKAIVQLPPGMTSADLLAILNGERSADGIELRILESQSTTTAAYSLAPVYTTKPC